MLRTLQTLFPFNSRTIRLHPREAEHEENSISCVNPTEPSSRVFFIVSDWQRQCEMAAFYQSGTPRLFIHCYTFKWISRRMLNSINSQVVQNATIVQMLGYELSAVNLNVKRAQWVFVVRALAGVG